MLQVQEAYYVAKEREAYSYGKRGLLSRKRDPSCGKRNLFICQKSPIIWQKRPIIRQKRQTPPSKVVLRPVLPVNRQIGVHKNLVVRGFHARARLDRHETLYINNAPGHRKLAGEAPQLPDTTN